MHGKTIQAPNFSYKSASFVRDYLPRFRDNFGTFCVQMKAAPQLPTSPNLYAEKLYLAMFNQQDEGGGKLLMDTINQFVVSTFEAEPVLLKTWMRMVADFVNVLEANASSTRTLLELTQWIDQLSSALYHAYFHVSLSNIASNVKWTEAQNKKAEEVARDLGSILRKEGDEKPLLDCHCYFRGTEVEFKLHLEKVNGQNLIGLLEPRHAAVVSRQPSLLIDHPSGNSRVVVDVKDVDMKTRKVILHHGFAIGPAVERRSAVRVEPAEPIDVRITHDGGQSRGTIIDISQDTIAMYLRNTGVDIASELQLQFNLPGNNPASGENELKIKARVTHVRGDRRGDPRAHVLVLALEDNTGSNRIDQYVAHRQTEILKEIRHIVEGRA